jgi:hypothetical protein
MKHFESVSLPGISIAEGFVSPSIKRKSIFARFIQALHVSRRRQARYFIRRHRHLVAPDFGTRPMVIDFESRKPEESNANANGHQTPVIARDRSLADA